MNKGILKSSGEYLLFLNSGDFLFSPQVLENLFSHKEDADLICCSLKIDLIDKNESMIYFIKSNKITNRFMFKYFIPHPSTLIKRDLFMIYGLYDESYKIAGDYEFFIRILKEKVKYVIIPLVLSVFNNQGISSTNQANLERIEVQKLYFKKRYFFYKKLGFEKILKFSIRRKIFFLIKRFKI